MNTADQWRDVAEFEARVAIKFAIAQDTVECAYWEKGGCELGKRFSLICVRCFMTKYRLEVEAEMESEGK